MNSHHQVLRPRGAALHPGRPSLAWAARPLALFFALLLAAAACSAVPSIEADAPTDSEAASATTADGEATDSISAPDAETSTEPTEPRAPFEPTWRGEVPAPEFSYGEGDWFNVSRPLSMQADLAGKVVMLDFWTQGCVNCLHVIDDLHRLEQEFPDELAVVGVHWAKFDRENQSEAVGQAVRRLGVQHPVVNDHQRLLQQAYQVRAWPTIALIDPLGRVVGTQAGEGVYDLFQPIIATMAQEYGDEGLIDRTPLGELLDAPGPLPTVLNYPGKVLADEAGDRLFIADTGRHRVLVADLEGNLQQAIGTGNVGTADGSFDQAQFNQPQGLALSADGDTLYIADRENHLIRAADLRAGQVTTIAGTGELLGAQFRPGPATEVAIASPWDVHLVGGTLIIAGAGRHQLWELNLSTGELDRFAGTGGEGIDDGPRGVATFSQPSGIAGTDRSIFVTDPEASAIREIGLDPLGEVTTLIGEGLFVWGDAVGTLEETLLQHAVGIELVGTDQLYIADTYNHRIKLVDLAAGTSSVVVGNGQAGLTDGAGEAGQLAEPSGLSATSTTLYIADTNNHRVRTLDLATGALTTLALGNLDVARLTASGLTSDVVTLPPQQIAPGAVEVVGDFELPVAYKYNDQGLFTYTWTADSASLTGDASYEARGPETPVRFDARLAAGAEALVLTAESTVFYCPAVDEAFCLVRDITIHAPIEISPDGDSTIRLLHRLPSAEELDSQVRMPSAG